MLFPKMILSITIQSNQQIILYLFQVVCSHNKHQLYYIQYNIFFYLFSKDTFSVIQSPIQTTKSFKQNDPSYQMSEYQQQHCQSKRFDFQQNIQEKHCIFYSVSPNRFYISLISKPTSPISTTINIFHPVSKHSTLYKYLSNQHPIILLSTLQPLRSLIMPSTTQPVQRNPQPPYLTFQLYFILYYSVYFSKVSSSFSITMTIFNKENVNYPSLNHFHSHWQSNNYLQPSHYFFPILQSTPTLSPSSLAYTSTSPQIILCQINWLKLSSGPQPAQLYSIPCNLIQQVQFKTPQKSTFIQITHINSFRQTQFLFSKYLFSFILEICYNMKINLNKSFVLLIILPLFLSIRYNTNLSSWTFTIQNDTKIYKAKIPSTLSLDLVDNNIISNNTYYRDNFLKYYQYQTKDASYTTQFNIPQYLLNSTHQYLIFQGLDTHAQVYLNNKTILSAHNMFRRYEIPVNFIKENTLVVNFTSSTKYDLQKQSQFKDLYGFTLPQNYSFTRKAAYQYGWDWGPRILTVGIWKEVRVSIYNDSKIENLRFLHTKITKTRAQIGGTVQTDLMHLDSNANYNLSLIVTKKSNNQTIYQTFELIASKLETSLSFNFSIGNINTWKDYIWWTWDLGNRNLIVISITLQNLNTSETINSSLTTGIRTINVIQQNKTFNGTSFTFNLNGYDIYMRGGNYIPPQMSLARTDKTTYQKITEYALFAKFNMIRLWGGGQFQKDQFYQAMDQAGILIWHDLMFACALYPSSQEILDNIAAEMQDNVKRIRHHPSMALWNGNNEIWIGWQEWGWKKGLSDSQKQLVQKMYNDVFRVVLPQVLNKQHPQVYYWQTSPSVSSGSTSSINNGDIHFWRVWGGGTKIEEYQEYIGRFNSQYGMQSMPEMSSIQQFTTEADRTINNYILRLHERHPYGDVYLPGYTYNYSGTTSNLSRFSYFSQVMQSYALEMAISSLRLNKPYNMGSLYWQLNDVWPVSSWATVDYYGTYKAAQYRIRQVYEELMIHTLHDTKNGDYTVYIVNQKNHIFYCHCTLMIELYSGQSTQLNFTVERTVGPFERVIVRRFTKNECANFTQTGFIKARLETTENDISSNNYFFVTMKDRPNLIPNLTYNFEGFNLRIKTDKLASYIWIYRKKGDSYIPLNLSNNYFTLTANQQKLVQIGDIPRNEIFVTCYELQFNAQKKQTKYLRNAFQQ